MRFGKFRKTAIEKSGLYGWIFFIIWLCLIVVSFTGCSNEEQVKPEEQIEPDRNVTVDIGPGCIDIQAPGFSGKCERCPEDCR